MLSWCVVYRHSKFSDLLLGCEFVCVGMYVYVYVYVYDYDYDYDYDADDDYYVGLIIAEAAQAKC